jgi:pimeloyl-ACP methyl ester carboxylesterase
MINKPIMKKNLLAVCFERKWMTITFLLFMVLQTYSQEIKPLRSGYAPVNGSKVYYEIYGEGKPIVLLHGAYMTIGLNWGELIPTLAKTRKVIALEMEGHGHTPISSRPLSWELLADDVVNALKELKIDSADIVGYSFGGTIAYYLAINYPKLVNRMVIISSTYRYDGWQKEGRDVLTTMKPEFLTNTPLKTAYDEVAPEPARWNDFLSKMIAFAVKPFNLGDDKIKAIKCPVLLISGDNDGINKPILFETYRQLGGGVFADMGQIPKSQMAIIPGQGHVSVMMQSQVILQLLNGFLK